MHESALIFVPAATFGQIIPKCDRYSRRHCQGEFEIVRVWIALWIYFRMLCAPPRARLAMFYGRLDFSKMKFAALLPGFLLKSPEHWQSSSARRYRWERAKQVVE
jgi:hypothetical protein